MRQDIRTAPWFLRVVPVAAVLLLAACAGGNKQLRGDLKTADAPCHDETWPDRTHQVDCFTRLERPVWARDEPATLDLYDAYAAQRAELAHQVDLGSIPKDQYRDKLSDIDDKFRKEIAARRKATAETKP